MPRYQKAYRKVYISENSVVHNGVDFNPSIATGLYVDPELKAPPVIEMLYLTIGRGKHIGIDFDHHLKAMFWPSSDLREHLGATSISAARRVLQSILKLDRTPGSGKGRASHPFEKYIDTRSFEGAAEIRNAGNEAAYTLMFQLAELGSLNLPESAGDPRGPMAKVEGSGQDYLELAKLFGTSTTNGLVDIGTANTFTPQVVQLAAETALRIHYLIKEAEKDALSPASHILDFVVDQITVASQRAIEHPQRAAEIAEKAGRVIAEIHYLSQNLVNVRVLAVGLDDSSVYRATAKTKNPYDFQHDFPVLGQLWFWDPDAGKYGIEGYGHMNAARAAEQYGFQIGPEAYREYQLMLPRQSRERILADIPTDKELTNYKHAPKSYEKRQDALGQTSKSPKR
jgi:hypothetical protein